MTCCRGECDRKLNRLLQKEGIEASEWVNLKEKDISDLQDLELSKVLCEMIGAQIWVTEKTSFYGWQFKLAMPAYAAEENVND